MVIPNDKDLRATIIRQYHDHRLAGHPGIYKTHETLTRDYWWPTVKKDVQEYIKGCATCQRVKPRSTSLAAPLHPNEIPDGNWTTISTDIIGPLPEAHGYNAINIIVDRKSKLGHFVPTTIELSSLGQAKIYRDHIFRLHGIPQKIISDRGPQYVSKFMEELYRLLDIKGG
jgi:Integrase zinc binding domain